VLDRLQGKGPVQIRATRVGADVAVNAASLAAPSRPAALYLVQTEIDGALRRSPPPTPSTRSCRSSIWARRAAESRTAGSRGSSGGVILIGWALTTIFVAGFTRLVRTA
jgi:hypothetical protein